jgi:hypothetical protein
MTETTLPTFPTRQAALIIQIIGGPVPKTIGPAPLPAISHGETVRVCPGARGIKTGQRP